MTKLSFIWGKPPIREEEWCSLSDFIGGAVEAAGEDSLFADGNSFEFHIRNDETGEIVRFNVCTDFHPSFWGSR